ncbi:MAG: endoribonuclease [Promethearchaeota archaeon]
MYKNSKTPKEGLFYSKLAILEFCGWIEESMDDIINRCALKHLKKASNIRNVNELISRISGFEYNNHFRIMLIKLLGIIHIEKLEKRVDQVKFQQLKSTLGSLKGPRNIQAHTHLKGAMITLDAPSVTKRKFLIVYNGLKEFEGEIKRLKFKNI